MWRRIGVGAVVLGILGLVSGGYARAAEGNGTDTQSAVKGEITFLHIGDTHYKHGKDNSEKKRERYKKRIKMINNLPGTPYPDGVGGTVGQPLGVFHVGDLTEGSREDMRVFAELWGLTGEEGLLNYALYEGAGNHDGKPSTKGGEVRQAIIERNKNRQGLTSVSERGLHYSLDHQGVHFVQLNEYAGYEDDESYAGNGKYNRKSQNFGNPSEKSLQFLEQTLEENVGDSGRPVIVAQHYPFDAWGLSPWSENRGWWTEQQVLNLWEQVAGYNVIAFLVGHDHSHKINHWNGIPVYHMDTKKGIGVYRIKDGEMVRVVRNAPADTWGGVHRQSTSIFAGPPDELIQGPYLIYNDDPATMTVLWRTNETVKSTLRWGTKGFRFNTGKKQVEPWDEDLNLYRTTLTDLDPNRRYTYQLRIDGQNELGMFYSAPAEDADRVKFMVYGSTGAGLQEQRNVSSAMFWKMYEDPAYHSLLVHTGNWVSDMDSVEAWNQQFFSRDTDPPGPRSLHRRMPIMGAAGPREKGTDTGLFQKLFPYDYGHGAYHSFQYGPAHVTVMDPREDFTEGSRQYEWLVSDLKQAEARWKMLIYSGNSPLQDSMSGGESAYDILEPLLKEEGVDVVVDGGADGYSIERSGAATYIGLGAQSRPQKPDKMYFGAVEIEGGTFSLEILDDQGTSMDSVTIKE